MSDDTNLNNSIIAKKDQAIKNDLTPSELANRVFGNSTDELTHYGMPRRSGRYKWGSGKEPYQHAGDFESRVAELKNQGCSEKEIAETIGLSINHLRIQQSLAKDERRLAKVDTAEALRAKGYTPTQIAKQMGYPSESSVRSLLNEKSKDRMNQAKATADLLRKEVDEKRMVDVGPGVERELGIKRDKLDRALYLLEMEGYNVYTGGVPNVTNKGTQINRTALCAPDVQHKEIYNFDQVKTLKEYTSRDAGITYDKLVYPKSMDSSRIAIRYKEDGGIQKDGVIEIRRGVDDLSLGDSHYAQVRILVDDKKYLKGMAIYSDKMPKGVDVVFNTNKSKATPKDKVFKDITNDPDNPFGATIKVGGQSYYTDKSGKKQLSVINKRAEEGDWSDWNDTLPAQFLAKQSMPLIKKQLGEAIADKQFEYDEIMQLTNPTVKKARLKAFSDSCDASAVHLKAAALPGQKYHVIMPITTIKEDEVYCTNYDNGTTVALIRYPHGGTFEIPIVTVNNKHKDSIAILGKTPSDTIGISSKVAERLSGADFDGDTVMVIPTNKKTKIASTPQLEQLKGFDPKDAYPEREGMIYMKRTTPTGKVIDKTGLQMGIISNLITDMTIKGASRDELAMAVKHSMVVIDAAKHKLDYKKSEADNKIAALKKAYQSHIDDDGVERYGASTLISRSKSEVQINKRHGSPHINKKGNDDYDPTRPEGALIYKKYHEEYIDPKTGKTKVRTQSITKMENTDDAYSLSSGRIQETEYAEYANKMKAMANQARLDIVSTKKMLYDSKARAAYQKEVDSISSKLNIALLNAPRERQAQALANSSSKAKKEANPNMSKKDQQKEAQRALTAARIALGAKKQPITLTDREWEAIQKGAVSETTLKKVIDNMDTDDLVSKATPRTKTTVTAAKANKITNMKKLGYNTAEIAKGTGLSVSVVEAYINPSKNNKL